MSELPRSTQDMAFARGVAEQYQGAFFEAATAQRLGVSGDRFSATLLTALGREVSRYIGTPPAFLPDFVQRLLESEIALARRLFTAGNNGVLMLQQAGNGFGLDVIVDVFNERARRAISIWGRSAWHYQDDGPEGALPPGPPLTQAWIDDVERGRAPVRLASEREGMTSFLTLFSDALRISATTSVSGSPVYTASCNLTGWVLEAWPQFAYSPKRFGSQVTSPVTDTLPTSGNYMFQGLKSGLVKKDPTPHYFGPSRLKTLVNL